MATVQTRLISKSEYLALCEAYKQATDDMLSVPTDYYDQSDASSALSLRIGEASSNCWNIAWLNYLLNPTEAQYNEWLRVVAQVQVNERTL